jgi:xanthine dehydrogenase YagR molybdenum-binding subunit
VSALLVPTGAQPRCRAKLYDNGSLLLQSAVTDIGPGTATAMTQIASDTIGIKPEQITFQLGNSEFPQAPNQGGSSTVNSVGSAVVAVLKALQKKILMLATTAIYRNLKARR